jgi:hypothetical protein
VGEVEVWDGAGKGGCGMGFVEPIVGLGVGDIESLDGISKGR